MQWSVDVDDLLFWMFEYKCCIHLRWSGYLVSISFYCVYLNVTKVTHWDFNTRIFIQDLHYQLLVLIAAREAKLKLKFPETSKAATSANLKISISIFKLMRERLLTISGVRVDIFMFLESIGVLCLHSISGEVNFTSFLFCKRSLYTHNLTKFDQTTISGQHRSFLDHKSSRTIHQKSWWHCPHPLFGY